MTKSNAKPVVSISKEIKLGRNTYTVNDALDHAFTLGSQIYKDSPLNEHGFGFKHAIATANPDNDSWMVATKTDADVKKGQFKTVHSPYSFDKLHAEIKKLNRDNWPGLFLGETGTFIQFECSNELFDSVTNGIKGNHGFTNKIKLLAEDIGFTYSRIIKDGIADIKVRYKSVSSKEKNLIVSAVEPDFEKYIGPGSGRAKIDLNDGPINVEYEFSAIKKSDELKKYYQKNMSTSGVEISLNGRVIAYSLFKEIWGIEKHNSYNYLLVRLNLISNDLKKLPATRTSKNGIRKGDDKILKVFQWIRTHLPEPVKNLKDSDDELDLFEKLANIKKSQLEEVADDLTLTTEQKVFKELKDRVRIDLYQFTNNNLIIYEGKKDETSLKDVYQLLMYWDGCVVDGMSPNKGILLASRHKASVIGFINIVNKMKDQEGRNYNLIAKTWKEEGIDYP